LLLQLQGKTPVGKEWMGMYAGRGGNGATEATLADPDMLQGRGMTVQTLKAPRMSRDEEVCYAKRLEFFKRRLVQAIQKERLPREVKRQFQEFKECTKVPLERRIAPLCRSLSVCEEGKAGYVNDCYTGYTQVRGKFVERNMSLVMMHAGRYRSPVIQQCDLIQEGNAALIRAVEKFDWRKGVRFSTYATFWIKQAIERCITSNLYMIRLPTYLQQKARKYRRNGKDARFAKALSVQDFAEEMGVPRRVAGHILEAERGHISLNSPLSGEEEEFALTDKIAGNGAARPLMVPLD